jgi:hypothetical protein
MQLVDSIAHVKGCNYFTVTSSPEFKKLMEQDLEYVVTPCCFDVDIKIAEGRSSPVRVQRYAHSHHTTHTTHHTHHTRLTLHDAVQSVRFARK